MSTEQNEYSLILRDVEWLCWGFLKIKDYFWFRLGDWFRSSVSIFLNRFIFNINCIEISYADRKCIYISTYITPWIFTEWIYPWHMNFIENTHTQFNLFDHTSEKWGKSNLYFLQIFLFFSEDEPEIKMHASRSQNYSTLGYYSEKLKQIVVSNWMPFQVWHVPLPCNK